MSDNEQWVLIYEIGQRYDPDSGRLLPNLCIRGPFTSSHQAARNMPPLQYRLARHWVLRLPDEQEIK